MDGLSNWPQAQPEDIVDWMPCRLMDEDTQVQSGDIPESKKMQVLEIVGFLFLSELTPMALL